MRTVIKIGTSTLCYAGGRLNIRRVEELCKVISDLRNSGLEIIIVSSGAIAMGCGKMSLSERPRDIPGKQAAAAVGQCELMYIYDKLFSEYNHTVAQMLISADDIRDDKRHANFTNALNKLLEMDIIPVINENDTIATEELGIGDNDTLAAQVAASVRADELILLSDIDGLYTADPHRDSSAKLITEVREFSDEIMKLGGGAGSSFGTGGMRTKLIAAKICTESGCDMLIVNGSDPVLLYDAAEGKPVGTRFYAKGK
ncbi:MAG: glutamate 5-kinase [Firmicutes bacterium]|nr:glutamate 5-kinase [Bacillota bacterium]